MAEESLGFFEHDEPYHPKGRSFRRGLKLHRFSADDSTLRVERDEAQDLAVFDSRDGFAFEQQATSKLAVFDRSRVAFCAFWAEANLVGAAEYDGGDAIADASEKAERISCVGRGAANGYVQVTVRRKERIIL
jgi:hypothetical protein